MWLGRAQNVGDRLRAFPDVETDAVLSVDEDVDLVTDEVDFALSVWRNFPERVVGFSGRNHVWDEGRHAWSYTSKLTNDYSMVLTRAAIYHRSVNYSQ